MKKPRHNPKLVWPLVQFYVSATARCIVEHWTCNRFIEERGKLPYGLTIPSGNGEWPTMTREDNAIVFGAQRATFDLVNGGNGPASLLEWRLGFENVTTAYPAKQFPWTGDGKTVPTHGAHFWKGSNDLFSEWKDLSK